MRYEIMLIVKVQNMSKVSYFLMRKWCLMYGSVYFVWMTHVLVQQLAIPFRNVHCGIECGHQVTHLRWIEWLLWWNLGISWHWGLHASYLYDWGNFFQLGKAYMLLALIPTCCCIEVSVIVRWKQYWHQVVVAFCSVSGEFEVAEHLAFCVITVVGVVCVVPSVIMSIVPFVHCHSLVGLPPRLTLKRVTRLRTRSRSSQYSVAVHSVYSSLMRCAIRFRV